MLARRPSPSSPLAHIRVRVLSTSSRHPKAAPYLFDVSGAAVYPPLHPSSSSLNTSSTSHPTSLPSAHPLRLVMFGKPGSGKGTLSSLLTKKYDIDFISSGDSLRRHIARRSPLGQKAEQLVAQGTFLPDEVMLQVVREELEGLRPPGGSWILDGFPRTVPQARMLDSYLARQAPPTPLTLVVHLDVPDEIILSRIRDRWVHLPSGRVYNLAYNPPRTPGVDDVTGEALTKRPDDTPEVFGRRLEVFNRETAPLIRYYKEGGEGTRIVSLKGETSDEIWPGLEREVRGFDVALKREAGEGKWERERVDEEVIRLAEKEDARLEEAVTA